MITYNTDETKTATRTCDICCVRQTIDPQSPLCARCLTEIVHVWMTEPIIPKPKTGFWRNAWDLICLWWSAKPQGYCVHCGRREDDCECR